MVQLMDLLGKDVWPNQLVAVGGIGDKLSLLAKVESLKLDREWTNHQKWDH